MHLIFKICFFAALTLLISSCSRTHYVIDEHHLDGNLSAYTFSSDLQNLLIRDRKTGIFHCLSPTPDDARANSDTLQFAAPFREGADASDSSSIVSLGGRNPEVLITRELMYRACELAVNINATPSETKAIYREFLDAITKIAKYQTGTGDAPAAQKNTAPSSLPSTAFSKDQLTSTGDDSSDDDSYDSYGPTGSSYESGDSSSY